MTKTGFNSDLTLMALNIYVHLGCGSKALVLFHRLDIKSIQFDSMGYLCFPSFSQLHHGKEKHDIREITGNPKFSESCHQLGEEMCKLS